MGGCPPPGGGGGFGGGRGGGGGRGFGGGRGGGGGRGFGGGRGGGPPPPLPGTLVAGSIQHNGNGHLLQIFLGIGWVPDRLAAIAAFFQQANWNMAMHHVPALKVQIHRGAGGAFYFYVAAAPLNIAPGHDALPSPHVHINLTAGGTLDFVNLSLPNGSQFRFPSMVTPPHVAKGWSGAGGAPLMPPGGAAIPPPTPAAMGGLGAIWRPAGLTIFRDLDLELLYDFCAIILRPLFPNF